MNFNHDTGSIDTILTIDTSTAPPLGGTTGVLAVVGTGALTLPSGTALQRPTGALGMVRGNSDSNILEAFNGSGWVDITKQGTVTQVAATGSTGLTVGGSPITGSGTLTFTLGTELQGLSGMASNGIVARTGSGSYAQRSINGTASNILVNNGDGVSGNPTINLATTITGAGPIGSTTTTPVITFDNYGRLTTVTSASIAFPVTSVFGRTGVVSAVAGDYSLSQIGTVSISSPQNGNVLTYNGTNWVNASPATGGTVTQVAATGSTGLTVGGSPITTSGTLTFTLSSELQGLSGLAANGLITRTAAGTYTSRSVAGTSGRITVSNGDGVSGNPTLDLATVSVGSTGTAFQKFAYDSYGRIANATAVVAGDITTLVDATYVKKAGDTMAGSLTFSSGTVTGLPTPTNDSDAANKLYVDTAVTGLSWKQSVRVASTANVTIATPGAAIDGVTLANGDRVLLKNQTTASQNGIYIFNGSAAAMTRAPDADSAGELVGLAVFVDQGTTNADTGWVQTTNAPLTVGSTNVVFAQFSGSGTYSAGTGLTLTGNTFSLTTPVTQANGGTGLSSAGTANQILGMNAGATALEYKSFANGTGINIVHTAGTVTINNTGVTSVSLSLPSIFNVTTPTVTTTGTLTAAFNNQAQNSVFAGPTSGTGAPTFRALVAADLPFKLYVENPSSQITPTAAGTNAVAIGSGSSAPGTSAFAVGAGTSATLQGSQAYANGSFATAGDAQNLQFVLRNITTNATATDLFVDGVAATVRPIPPNNSVWSFVILIAARRTDTTGGGAGYKFEGVIRKDTTAASTTLVGAVSKSILGETNTAWDAAITADTTNGALKVTVTGEASKTIRWVATCNIAQVTN